MDSGNGLLEALRAGNTADFQGDMHAETFAFKLRGSRAAIGQVIKICENGNLSTQTLAVEQENRGRQQQLSRVTLEARIRKVCKGSSQSEGAISEANVDGDDETDFLLDWSRVSCENTTVGRGGGYCGMQMCSVDVYASSVYQPGDWPQPILAYSHERAPSGEDYVLSTTVSGASCPITHRRTRYWGWNGEQLQVIRSQDVDVSGRQPDSSAVTSTA